MKRRRSGWSRANATLGDALSPLMKDRLHRLRDTLERQAREAVASQLAEARPPWRRHPEQRKITVLDKPNARRLLKPVPIPKKPTFEYWDFPSEAAAREPPPASNSHAERSHLEELLQAGTDSSTASGEELFVILGLDFGTSSTKAIVRLPYEAGEPTIAIPRPESCRSGDHPYLWQTVLWLEEEGIFLPWPAPGAIVLNSLKQGLIQGRSGTAICNSEATVAVN